MEHDEFQQFLNLTKFFSKPHPWHGISVGEDAPRIVRVYIEIVPGDTMKYELDKETGYLKVDRPQKFSNICPSPYGFIPQTYCGDSVGEYCAHKTERDSIHGDSDPLDICVITERDIPHGNLLVDAKPIGGLRMIDRKEADDKIISVVESDALYGSVDDVSELPEELVERLAHYFLTYKQMPNQKGERKCEITDVYGREEAYDVIKKSRNDYRFKFEADKRELLNIMQSRLK